MTIMRTEFQVTRTLPHSVTWPGIPGQKASPRSWILAPSLPEVTIVPGSTPPALILGEAILTASSGATGPHPTLGYGPWQHEPQKWRPVLGGGHFLTLIRPLKDNQGQSVNTYISYQQYWLLKIDYLKVERSWAERHSDIWTPLNIIYFINFHSNFSLQNCKLIFQSKQCWEHALALFIASSKNKWIVTH